MGILGTGSKRESGPQAKRQRALGATVKSDFDSTLREKSRGGSERLSGRHLGKWTLLVGDSLSKGPEM